MQTQLTLAYAMTVHKSQGLTMPKIYPSLQGIFGFGMPYTLMTRTRLAEDMIFVGVPPADLYPALKAATAQHEESWKTALQSMIKVNEDFKTRGNDVLPKKDATINGDPYTNCCREITIPGCASNITRQSQQHGCQETESMS